MVAEPATVIAPVAPNEIAIYPNPAANKSFYIKTGSEWLNKDILVRVYSMDGRIIVNNAVHQQQAGVIEIKLSSAITPGIYIVQLNDRPAIKLVVN